MDDYESLSHTKWECKYHVVFIPKYRRKALYGELRQYLGDVFRKLALQKESLIEQGYLMPDHVHTMIAKSTTIKDRGGKSGGRAGKAVDLTSADLRRVWATGLSGPQGP
jgi:putative transposase